MLLQVWLELSELHRRKGDARAAVRTFQSACEVAGELVKTKQIPPRTFTVPVRGHYEQALRREPSDGVSMNNLAFLLANADAETDIDRALVLAERARRALPAVSEVAYNLGCIYLKGRRPADAMRELQAALEGDLTPETRQQVEQLLRKLVK